MYLVAAAFVFFLALLYALLEIEMEGKNGWAEKLPTWYCSSGFAKPFCMLNSGKPLTGYHLYMNLFIVAAFHLGFFQGATWTLPAELQTLSLIALFMIAEDFLWFLFNPCYGAENFQKEKVWWHSQSRWVFGLFPADYGYGLLVSFLLASLAASLLGAATILLQWAAAVIIIIILVLASSLFVPTYRSWYTHMREKDERTTTKIFHK